MNATKDVVAMAPNYKFDRSTHTWVAANPSASTVGRGGAPAQPAAPSTAPTPRPQER
jgi:hypothetical protein